MTSLVVLVVAVAGSVLGERWWRTRRTAARAERHIEAAVPDVTDLIVVVVGAGGTVADALRLVADRGPAVVQPAFTGALARAAAGATVARSLVGVGEELGAPFRPLIAALIATERDGAPISSLVLRLGDEARVARRVSHERRARTLPVQLLFPLVCCSLPAVVVGAVVPLALVALGRLGL